MKATGQCQCGTVVFEVTGPLGAVRYCHCLSCRRATGSAFSANAKIPLERFEVRSGRDALSRYEARKGVVRHFCARCGSSVYVTLAAEPDFVRPRIGALEGDIDVSISAHVWVSDKAPWHEIADGLPQFEEAAP